MSTRMSTIVRGNWERGTANELGGELGGRNCPRLGRTGPPNIGTTYSIQRGTTANEFRVAILLVSTFFLSGPRRSCSSPTLGGRSVCPSPKSTKT